MAGDLTKLSEIIKQRFIPVKLPEKITRVASFEKFLIIATANGNVRIADFSAQGEKVFERVHLTVKLISR